MHTRAAVLILAGGAVLINSVRLTADMTGCAGIAL